MKKKTNSESSRWPLLDTRERATRSLYGQGPTGVGIARCERDARVQNVPTLVVFLRGIEGVAFAQFYKELP